MHLKKLKVRDILPEGGSNKINIGDAATVTRFHGEVEMPERSLEFPEVDGEELKEYVDNADQEIKDTYLPLSAGDSHKLSGTLYLDGSRVINAVSGEAGKLRYNGGERFKWGSSYMWCFKPLDMQEHRVLNVHSPEQDGDAANKKYVDDKAGGVPVGSIMFWLNSVPPSGWFKLHGGTFDVDKYPKLHSYLNGTEGYKSGYLPNWAGRYPVEYGDHVTADLGSLVGFRTALPTNRPITAKTSSIPDGRTRTFNGAGGTNAYSDGLSQISVTLSGGDNVTRPPSVIGHYIIKHD